MSGTNAASYFFNRSGGTSSRAFTAAGTYLGINLGQRTVYRNGTHRTHLRTLSAAYATNSAIFPDHGSLILA